jgi:uroporphyrinogen-III synthase
MSHRNSPLHGRRIIVTRASGSAGDLVRGLRDAGAEVIEFPVTRIEPLDPARLRAALARLGAYHWLVFTSRNGVRIFFDVLHEAGLDARALANARVAAVGPATRAELSGRGVAVALEPERYVAEGVLEAMQSRDDVRGSRVLYATAAGARDVLPRGLESLGATVDRIEIYRSAPDVDPLAATGVRQRLEAGEIDLVSFTAGSAVQGFVDAVGIAAARRASAASIGPATSEVARAAGLDVAIEASESTIPGLVDAIVRHLGREA